MIGPLDESSHAKIQVVGSIIITKFDKRGEDMIDLSQDEINWILKNIAYSDYGSAVIKNVTTTPNRKYFCNTSTCEECQWWDRKRPGLLKCCNPVITDEWDGVQQ